MLTYVLTYIVLLLLTALTFGLSLAGSGVWSIISAMSIAVAKSALITLFFMHIDEHGRSSRLAFLAGVSLTVVFVGFAMIDVVSRVPSLSPAAVNVQPFGP